MNKMLTPAAGILTLAAIALLTLTSGCAQLYQLEHQLQRNYEANPQITGEMLEAAIMLRRLKGIKP